MEENESREGIDYAEELKIQSQIEKAIEIAILHDKTQVSLYDGKSMLVLKLVDEKEKGAYKVLMGDAELVTVKRDSNGKMDYQGYKLDLSRLQNRYNSNNIRIITSQERIEQRRVKRQVEKGRPIKEVSPSNKQADALKLEIEQKLKTGHAVEMEIDREISTTENMHMFVERAFGVSAQKIYRVQGNDPHDFKYVANISSNPSEPVYKELNLSSRSEGRNSNQKVWVMKDGVLIEKTVDSLLIKGNYALATDLPDSVASQNTQTYLCARTPKGQYIAIAAGQKQGVNRNTSGDSIQKDIMSRENSVYDLEDIIMAAELAEKIYGFNKDGKLTTKEIEIVRKFRVDKNMEDEDVINIINAICLLREIGYSHNEIKDIIDDVKDAPKDKESTLKLAEKFDTESKDSKKQGEDEEGQKTMHDGHDGIIRRGPQDWN